MSEKFIKKNIHLSLDFDRYVSERPDFIMRIPNKGYVVITVKGDENFNRQSRALVANVRNKKKVVEARKEGNSWKLYSLAPA